MGKTVPQASSFGDRWRIADCCKDGGQPERRGTFLMMGRLWIMWVSTKGVHIGCFQGDERILKRFAVPPCMLEECNMI